MNNDLKKRCFLGNNTYSPPDFMDTPFVTQKTQKCNHKIKREKITQSLIKYTQYKTDYLHKAINKPPELTPRL